MNRICHTAALCVIACTGFTPAFGLAEPQLASARTAFNELRFRDATALLAAHKERHGATAAALYLQARIAVVRGQLDDAKQAASLCRERFPRDSLCYEVSGEADLIRLLVRGGVLSKIGSARQARKALEKAVEFNPENMRARLLLVRFYSLAPWFLGGSKAKARRQVSACRAQSAAWGHEAQALYDLGVGNTRAAVEGFAKAQALLPHERDPALFLAKAYIADQQPASAIATLERLVEKYPRFQEAWLELGNVAADSGLQSVRGMAALERFLDNAQDESTERRAAAGYTLAQLYLRADRPAEAVSALEQAQTANPRDKQIQRLLKSICADRPEICASAGESAFRFQ